VTGATRCPRFAATSPIAPWSCRPKPARDAATPGPPPDASAAARARRLDALRARLAVDGAPVCCGAGAGNPGRTRTGARAPSRRPRTTSDTPYTEPAPWQRLPSAPLHRAGPLPGAPPRPPWITIAPPEATTSAGAVGHDRAVGWITSRAPLKPWRAMLNECSSSYAPMRPESGGFSRRSAAQHPWVLKQQSCGVGRPSVVGCRWVVRSRDKGPG
jgi:hypothetical protein